MKPIPWRSTETVYQVDGVEQDVPSFHVVRRCAGKRKGQSIQVQGRTGGKCPFCKRGWLQGLSIKVFQRCRCCSAKVVQVHVSLRDRAFDFVAKRCEDAFWSKPKPGRPSSQYGIGYWIDKNRSAK